MCLDLDDIYFCKSHNEVILPVLEIYGPLPLDDATKETVDRTSKCANGESRREWPLETDCVVED